MSPIRFAAKSSIFAIAVLLSLAACDSAGNSSSDDDSDGYTVSGTAVVPAGLTINSSTQVLVYLMAEGATDPSVIVSTNLSSAGYTGSSSYSYDYALADVPEGTYTLGALVDLNGNPDDSDDWLVHTSTSVTVGGDDLSGQTLTMALPTGYTVTVSLTGYSSGDNHLIIGGTTVVNGVANDSAGGGSATINSGAASFTLGGSGGGSARFDEGTTMTVRGLIDMNDNFSGSGPDTGDYYFTKDITIGSANYTIDLTSSDLSIVP